MLIGLVSFTATSMGAIQTSDIPVSTNTHNAHQNAGESQTYRFMARTRLRINSTNSPINVTMDVDAMSIGEKTVTVEINCSQPVLMNMTCKENMDGLQNGSTIRNRNRFRYNYGFAANISVNCTNFTATLKAEVGDSKGYKWAYLEGDTLIDVPTEIIDGEAIAEVDHFSTWILVSTPSIGLGMTALTAGLVMMGMVLVIYKMKKH